MKKVFFLLLTAVLLVACEKPEKKGTSQVLKQAICKMNIDSQNKRKAVDIVGDSVSVHRLSRYVCNYSGQWVDFGPDHNKVTDPMELADSRYFFTDGSYFRRDTLAHTFSFHSDYIVRWEQEHIVDGVYIGVDGTEYLGWLTCTENVVFQAVYDTALKRYRDPYLYPGDFDLNDPNQVLDTLGYIPNSLMRKNRAILQKMMDEKRFVDMVDFFKSGAYTIYTCTGEEYRELARQGLN